jgi:hypothetical protein
VTAVATRHRRLLLVPDDDVSERVLHVPDKTEEFTAQDVLDMLEVASTTFESRPSLPSSIAPVDLDAEPFDLKRRGDLASRRRGLSRYVVGAVALACGILAIAVVRHRAEIAVYPVQAESAEAPAPASEPAPVDAVPAVAEPTSTSSSSGLIRFTTPPGWAWVDGVQLAGTSAFLPCGAHKVQTGGEEPHVVDVPCGGEVVVTR